MIKKFVGIFLIMAIAGAWHTMLLRAEPSDSLKHAQSALDDGDKRTADFWIARYLGSRGRDAQIESILKQRHLPPAGFLASVYDKEFLDWFVRKNHEQWNVPPQKVRERFGSVEIAHARDGIYSVSVVAYPEIQAWFLSGGDSTPLYLAVGASSKRHLPLVLVRKNVGGVSLEYPLLRLDTRGHAFSHLWAPELFDLDGDGTPEVWLRYNLLWGNGFSQVLDIYEMKEGRGLVLLKRFQGDSEGLARRVGDKTIEVAKGGGSRSVMAHFDFDKHHFETWEFKKDAFKKTSERQTDHFLRNSTWKEYYSSLYESR